MPTPTWVAHLLPSDCRTHISWLYLADPVCCFSSDASLAAPGLCDKYTEVMTSIQSVRIHHCLVFIISLLLLSIHTDKHTRNSCLYSRTLLAFSNRGLVQCSCSQPTSAMKEYTCYMRERGLVSPFVIHNVPGLSRGGTLDPRHLIHLLVTTVKYANCSSQPSS